MLTKGQQQIRKMARQFATRELAPTAAEREARVVLRELDDFASHYDVAFKS